MRQELVANGELASELSGFGGELFLGLGGECWVDDLAINEEEHMALNLMRLQSNTLLVFPLDRLNKFAGDLVRDVFDVSTARSCGNRIDE